MNENDRNDTDTNATLQNGDVSSAICLLNSHNLPPKTMNQVTLMRLI